MITNIFDTFLVIRKSKYVLASTYILYPSNTLEHLGCIDQRILTYVLIKSWNPDSDIQISGSQIYELHLVNTERLGFNL